MGKILLKATKKIIALSLALILLFNSGAELYGYALEISEEISGEIRTSLQQVLAEQEGKNSYQKCLLGEEKSCKEYLGKIKKEFSQSAQQADSEKSAIESQKSYKEFKAEYEKAIEEEYKKGEAEIEKGVKEALILQELSWETINAINYFEKKSKAELEKWRKEAKEEIREEYKRYEKEYQSWRVKAEEEAESLGKKYLKAEGEKIIKAYEQSKSKGSKELARELLVVLLNSERSAGEFIEERQKAEKIFIEGLIGDPCAYNKGGQKLTKSGADKYIGYDKPGVYPNLTREDWEIIPASYKDEKACENAFISLEGLSYLKRSEEGVKEVKRFMSKNSRGLAAYDSLLSGSAVLLKWKAYSSLKSYIENSFKKEKSNENKGIGGFGGISETLAYNGRYLGEESVYTQREDGQNAWEDLAGLLSEEGSKASQELLKMSLSGCKVVKEVVGRDKLECETILPFLYGALIYAPKVMDKAEPYQEAIPLEKEYFDKNGKVQVIDKEGIKRKNALIKKEFNEKIREYGNSVSSGLAGFLYSIKFNDMPVASKMALDNRLAKVYSNIKGYSKGSARYKSLQTGRTVVAIFKYVGVALDIWCFVSLAGMAVKGVGGARALIKAKNLMKGAKSLSVGQRANILRQIAFIQEGWKVRRFGRNTIKGIISSADIGRRINAGVYLAEKNGMGTINYMLHNVAYGRGKNISLSKNILRVEGIESKEFYKSSHYIAGKHKDIFRINRDIRRGVKVGISELGEGGNVLSYIDKAKLGIFKNYTEDYLKGQEAVKGSKGGKLGQGLMKGETSLLPREVLYSRKYKKILPFVQDYGYTKKFKLGENIYEGLRGEGFFVMNTKTGEIFNDYVFNFEGYLNKNNLLGGLITPSKKLARSNVSNFNTGTLINNEASFANEFNLAKNIDFLKVQKPLTISNKADGILALTKTFIPAINKEKIFGGLAAGNIFNFNISIEGLNIKLPKLSRSAGNIALQKFPGREITGLSAKNNILLGTNFSSEIIYKPGDPLSPVMYDGVETPKKEAIASVANELISKMLIYGVSHKLNQQQGIIYNNILQELYQVLAPSLEDPAVKLKNVLEKADWFMTETAPLVFLQGEDTIVLEPNHIDETDLFVYNISGQKDYKAFIAEKIKGLSSVQKEYTVYIQMHGQKDKSLKVDGKRTTTLDEILDIIEANKEDATVNVILGACFSGSALSLNLLRDKINVLLLSGANDVCTVYDSEFIRINDLRSSYIEAIKNGYYGAYLFYEGKIFNTLVDTKASLPKENPLNAELNILRKIYFSKEPLGLNLFKLLSMSPKYQAPQYPFTKLIKFSVPPQIFNMEANLNFFDNYIHHNKKSWEYVVEHYDDKWMFIDKKEIFFNEPKEETTSLLYNAAQEELKKAFPEWNYNPVPEDKFPGIPVMQTPEDSFLLSSDKKTSFLPGSNFSPAENTPVFSLLVPIPLSSNLRAWLTSTKYLSEKQKKVLPSVFDRALTQAAQAYVERQKALGSASKEDFIGFASSYLTLHLNAAGLSPLQTNSILKDFKAKADLLEFSLQPYEENLKLSKTLEEIVVPLIDQDLLNAVPKAKTAFSEALVQTEEYIGELTQEKLKGVEDIFAFSFLSKLTQEGVSLEDKRKLLANFNLALEEESSALSQIQQDFDKALQSAIEHADKIGTAPEKIRKYFTNHEESLKNLIEIIGLKGLTHSYQGKIDELNDLCNYADLIKNNFSEQAYELLLEKINPKQSKKYQELTQEMNILRKKAAKDPAFRKQRDEIISLQRKTGKGAGLLVHDALDKFKIIASIAEYNLPFAEELVNYILPKTPENELLWKRKYQAEIFKKMGIPGSPEFLEKVKITENSNIAPLLKARADTKENIKKIFELIDKNPNKSVAEIMEALPWNIRTKNIFKKLGIKWEAWVKPDAANIVKTQIKIDVPQEKEKFIEEVNIYTSSFLKRYPNLKNQALQKGIALKEEILYLEEKPVKTFTQATKVVSIIKKIIVSSEQQEIAEFVSTEFTKKLPHKAEVLSSIANGTQNITVRLADTNDISAMLSLGGKSACCRALGRLHEEAIASLITNKMATAFEVLAEDKVIGSIMVYLASVNGDLALVLGTLETKAVFAENDIITKAVVNYARQFAASIGKPHIPIYTAVVGQDKTFRLFIDTKKNPPALLVNDPSDKNAYDIVALGKVGTNPVYLSYNLSAKNEQNIAVRANLYHLEYPFEYREKASVSKKVLSVLNKYLKSLTSNQTGIVPGPTALILSEIEKMKAAPKLWTEREALNYLQQKRISNSDVYYIISYCRKDNEFDSGLFDLFVKGYQIKPDIDFDLVAFSYCIDRKTGEFDYSLYSKIYTIAKKCPQITIDDIGRYKEITPEQMESLFYIAENFPKENPFKVMDLSSNGTTYSPEKFNIDYYNKVIYFLEQGISFEAIKSVFTTCIDKQGFNEELFKEIDNVAGIVLSKKRTFLNGNAKFAIDIDIKDFVYSLAPEINNTLEISDMSTFLAAIDLKKNKFEKFVKSTAQLNLNLRRLNPIYKENFLEIFYPLKSEKAKELEEKIKALKSNFRPELKEEINALSKELRALLNADSAFSPQDKIEMISIIGQFVQEDKVKELLEIAKKISVEGKEAWNKNLINMISKELDGAYNENIEKKLNLLQSPYLGKLFLAISTEEDFKLRFKELLALVSKDNFDLALDKLHHNVETENIFDALELSYRKWTHPDLSLSRMFIDGKNFVEIRPVNMRNVSKSLFLGNEAHVCTAVDSYYNKYIIPNIMNTFVGAIEVVVNDKPVGNTMLLPIINKELLLNHEGKYTGAFKAEIALLIDDLRIVPPYNKHKYLQEVVALAQRIAEQIGIENGRVYISDSNTEGYSKLDMGVTSKFYLIGKSLDNIWLNATYTEAKARPDNNIEYVGTFVTPDQIKYPMLNMKPSVQDGDPNAAMGLR